MELIVLSMLTVAVFTLPGICLVIMLQIKQFRFLFVVALSLALYAICLAVAGNVGLDWSEFAFLYSSAVSVLLIIAAFCLHKYGRPAVFNEYFNWRDLAVICGILASCGAYIVVVGPYDELPADFYRHLERVQTMRSDLLRPQSNLAALHSGLNGRYWYYLYAMTWHVSGTTLIQSIYFYSWFNAALLLSALYLFSKALLHQRTQNAWMLALLTCIFFVLHHGTVSFSFIRYYALSATMICMPVYFLAILVFIRQIETGLPARQTLTAFFCLTTPLLYHYQEALFILVMLWLLSLYYTVTCYGLLNWQGVRLGALPEPVVLYWRGIKNQRQGLAVFIVITLSYIAYHLYAYSSITRSDVDHGKVISLHHLLPFFRNLYILNPSYQFYQTIALWGVVVYVGCLLAWRRFLLHPYITMGMLSPLFTVFNPVFVDFFLRVRDVHVLYRLAYIIPLHMAAACLVWFLLLHWRQHTLRHRSLIIPALALLIISLFSFDTRFAHSEYSRVPSLLGVEEKQSARRWGDLVDFLDGIEQPTEIFTDPVTGYLLTAYTHHHAVRYKFTNAFLKPINFEDYSDFPLKAYRGGLLVINLRDGGYSETGQLSKHWPADVLLVSRYYSRTLLNHVRENSALFPLLWAANGVRVYRIHP